MTREASEFFRRQCYVSAEPDEELLFQVIEVLGDGNVLFATDFPHIENEWPNSRPIIDKIYADIPEADKRKIWAGNAVEFFHLGN